MITPYWEHFEHEADIGVRGHGNTPAQAFEQAALAMMAIITDLSLIQSREVIELHCADNDADVLLTDWLNGVIYQVSTRKMLFGRFEVQIEDGQLTARAWGEAIDVGRHQPAVEIKGATFTELAVTQVNDHWLAQCVVDV